MQQHGSKYFACRPLPLTSGQKVKIQLFQNNVILHIKLKEIMSAATWSQILSLQRPHPPVTLGLGSKGQNSTLTEHGHVAYQIKGMMNAATC